MAFEQPVYAAIIVWSTFILSEYIDCVQMKPLYNYW